MDDFDESPAPRPKPSKIPSWIMLGFFLGAFFVWALPRQEPEPPSRSTTPSQLVISAPTAANLPRTTDLEAAFEAYSRFARWADDITYVSLWDAESKTFRDCFEVLRRGGEVFYRSVPRPRDWSARKDVPKECPLEFLTPDSEKRGVFEMLVSPPPPMTPVN